jgi:hypothetical protein
VQHERRYEVAVLQRRDPRGVVREDVLADAERRKHDHHVVYATTRPVQAPDRPRSAWSSSNSFMFVPTRSG